MWLGVLFTVGMVASGASTDSEVEESDYDAGKVRNDTMKTCRMYSEKMRTRADYAIDRAGEIQDDKLRSITLNFLAEAFKDSKDPVVHLKLYTAIRTGMDEQEAQGLGEGVLSLGVIHASTFFIRAIHQNVYREDETVEIVLTTLVEWQRYDAVRLLLRQVVQEVFDVTPLDELMTAMGGPPREARIIAHRAIFSEMLSRDREITQTLFYFTVKWRESIRAENLQTLEPRLKEDVNFIKWNLPGIFKWLSSDCFYLRHGNDLTYLTAGARQNGRWTLIMDDQKTNASQWNVELVDVSSCTIKNLHVDGYLMADYRTSEVYLRPANALRKKFRLSIGADGKKAAIRVMYQTKNDIYLKPVRTGFEMTSQWWPWVIETC